MLPISLDTFLNDLSARVGVQYTDEQKAFMRDFTSPIISFSSPGTVRLSLPSGDCSPLSSTTKCLEIKSTRFLSPTCPLVS